MGISARLAVLWVAVLSAERIDFLGGSAGFKLTPFLVVTPIFVAAELLRIGIQRERIRLPRTMLPYAVILVALLATAYLSALVGIDTSASARRVVHLTAVTLGTLVSAALLLRRADFARIVSDGAALGLAVALGFTVAQFFAFVTPGQNLVQLGPATIDLQPPIYELVVPRPTGAAGDPNRAGFLFLFYMACLVLWGRPGIRRRLWVGVGLLLLVSTLSRSAALACLITVGLALIASRSVPLPRAGIAAAAAGVFTVAAVLLLRPGLGHTVLEASEPVMARFSLEERSGQTHRYLLARGVEESTRSIKRATFGAGYGNSNLVLEDVFSGNEYGNFHSLYVTMWAETGIISLLLTLVLIGVPIVRGGALQPLVAGSAAFNVFYQSVADPVFWLLLALAWAMLPSTRASKGTET